MHGTLTARPGTALTLPSARVAATTPDRLAAAGGRACPGATLPLHSWRKTKVDVFEAALLMRCTGIGSPRYPRCSHRGSALPPTVFAEFSDAAAADRMAALLRGMGVPAGRDEVSAGGRRRYFLQRVSLPEPWRPIIRAQLDDAWQDGWGSLLSTAITGASSPLRSHRSALAAAAWRAALLAAGRRSRSCSLGIRVGDRDTAALLLRAARTLEVPAAMNSRSGCWLLTVPAGAPLEALLRVVALLPR